MGVAACSGSWQDGWARFQVVLPVSGACSRRVVRVNGRDAVTPCGEPLGTAWGLSPFGDQDWDRSRSSSAMTT